MEFLEPWRPVFSVLDADVGTLSGIHGASSPGFPASRSDVGTWSAIHGISRPVIAI
jgi:hypothetical protein